MCIRDRTNVNPLVTKNHPYYFRVCFVESYQGEALARYVYEQLKEKKSGILLPDDDDQATACLLYTSRCV